MDEKERKNKNIRRKRQRWKGGGERKMNYGPCIHFRMYLVTICAYGVRYNKSETEIQIT